MISKTSSKFVELLPDYTSMWEIRYSYQGEDRVFKHHFIIPNRLSILADLSEDYILYVCKKHANEIYYQKLRDM